MKRWRISHQRGSVLVLVAAAIFPLMLLLGFATDVPHWFDYSRNLQNRADAAALAAGAQFGGTCFGNPSPTDPRSSPELALGQMAQLFSGPTGSSSDLPYAYGSPVAAFPQFGGYQNVPNLISGNDTTGSHYHVLLNADNYKTASPAGTNFAIGDFCHGDPTLDRTDVECFGATKPLQGRLANDCAIGPMVDVKVTQDSVPVFFPFVNQPNISARARVVLQGAQSLNGVDPIVVPDPAQTPCLRAEVINDVTGALVNDAQGHPIDVAMNPPNNGATPPQPFWTVTLPAMNVPAAQLSVQAYIPDDCNTPGYPSGGTLYDGSNGLAFINTYNAYTVPVAAPTVGSVWLTPVTCTDAGEAAAQDAYFYYFPKSTSCTVQVNAQVDFQSSATNTSVWSAMDGGAPVQMTANGTDVGGHHLWTAQFQIPSESGRHTFTILWHTGNGNTKTAFNGGNPLQATYAAFSDQSDPPDDSGPVTVAQIGDNTGATSGVDSIQQGSSKTLTVAFYLQGLSLAQPGDPPIVLRAQVQNSKKTGAIDCGQGNAASGLHDAITKGCPDPVSIYNPAQGCVFYTTAVPLTCADPVPGNKRQQVVKAFDDKITSINSPCDNWQTYAASGTPISGVEPGTTTPDPRIFIFVVTAPGDLSGGVNSGPVRILGFATFYVTGYDGDKWLPNGNGNGGQKIPGCSAPANQDQAYPLSGTDKDQVWGHFIKFVAIGGTPNGQPCNPNDISTCIAALTR